MCFANIGITDYIVYLKDIISSVINYSNNSITI